MSRLPGLGLVDRSRPVSFRFDGKACSGFAGDTLASALLASGVKLFGRSFKYHRPRGLLTAGSEEPNALVELRTGPRREANTRATVVELYEGLEARSQNRWPSLAFDVMAVNTLLSPLFVAGFYYKTFMWPAKWWEKLYEPAIRRAAGLGRAALEEDPDTYEVAHAFCDVLVIGGGPAGLAAALAAARAKERVILCDEDFILGGRLNSERQVIDGKEGAAWASETAAELESCPEVRIMKRTTVFGVYDAGLTGARNFAALERVNDHVAVAPQHQPRQRMWKIVARRAVLAAGAIERPIVFGGNDRPGVMMASAVRTYLNRFGVAPGKRVAVFTACDDGLQTASDLRAAGIDVAAVIDSRQGSCVVEAHGSPLEAITVRHAGGRTERLQVDTLAVSGGWNPNLALTTHLGGRPRWDDSIAAFVPGDLPAGMTVVGSATGRHGDGAANVKPIWQVEGGRDKAFVDFQHDVTDDDVALAAREGFRAAEHLKRYTTLGMATDQGKTSNVNGQAIMAALTQRSIPEVGTTAFRPPYSPVAIGAVAGIHRGKHFRPTRLTAGHAWAKEQGAVFVESGQWLRAQWFPRPGEKDWLESAAREVKATRSAVGVCDVSTLGKIDIQGPDAGVFLDCIYTNMFSTLPAGKVRYGLMLREDGFVMDDGTTARLGEHHYLMSTTTVGAGKVMQHLEHARQVLWPDLDVQMVSVTEQWSQYSIAGPSSRLLLRKLLGDAIEVSNEAFPYLACADFTWKGRRCRLFRISFSGELAYELAVPARWGDTTIREIMAAGAELDIVPYGTEALGIMRVEKGHVAGNELNGTTTAADLGLGKMMSKKKDFIGRVLAQRQGLVDPARPALVGIKPVDRSQRLRAGAHFLDIGARPGFDTDQGYVTSAAYSPMLGHWIGLGLLARGPDRHGERVRAFDPLRDGDIEVEVVSPYFYDPDGERLRS